MHLHILGGVVLLLAAAGNDAASYPYRSSLLAYSPARGEFPVAQGYIRYYDANGSENLIGYNYPEPSATRRLSSAYDIDDAAADRRQPSLRTSSIDQSQLDHNQQEVLSKTREEHFRAWCEQRYRALKAEIDKLRAEGKQPSHDLMAQITPLEKIMTSITAATAEMSPEIKYAREEHLRIWNEARLKVAQQEREHLKLNEGYEQQPAIAMQQQQPAAELKAKDQLATIEETAEQKKARDEHLRSYQAQLLLIQQLEAKRLELLSRPNEEQLPSTSKQPEPLMKTIIGADLIDVLATPTAAVQQQASEENLKRLNEADSNYNKDLKTPESTLSYKYEPNLITIPKHEETQQLPLQSVKETPEVMRAREEHLKLVQEAQRKAASTKSSYNPKQGDDNDDGLYRPSPADISLKTLPGIRQPIQTEQQATLYLPDNPAQIEDTPEVKRAREEHLRLVDEAKLKVQIETEKNDKTAIIYSALQANAKNEEERLAQIEHLREAERIHADQQMREEERLREAERLLEEQRLMAADLLRLQKEEQQRIEQEQRLTEANTKQILQQAESLNERRHEEQQQQIGKQIVKSSEGVAYLLREQQKQNPFLVHLTQTQTPSDYYIGQYLDEPQNPEFPRVVYYPSSAAAVAGAGNLIINRENPFLIQYQQQQQQSRPELVKGYLDSAAVPKLPARPNQKSELKPMEADQKIGYISPSAASSMKIDYGQGAGLSQLEKATREHFRAHELALEQLRLANLQKPYTKDC